MKTSRLFRAGAVIAVAIICLPVIRAQTGDDLITAVTYQDLSKVKELAEAGVDVNYGEKRFLITSSHEKPPA